MRESMPIAKTSSTNWTRAPRKCRTTAKILQASKKARLRMQRANHWLIGGADVEFPGRRGAAGIRMRVGTKKPPTTHINATTESAISTAELGAVAGRAGILIT